MNQPGLQIINTVSTLAHDRSLPLLNVNNTNKFIKIYRHGLLAKILEFKTMCQLLIP